jgi:hypothetical protein
MNFTDSKPRILMSVFAMRPSGAALLGQWTNRTYLDAVFFFLIVLTRGKGTTGELLPGNLEKS